MTEDEYVEEIWRLRIAKEFEKALNLTERAVETYQNSAELQCWFGELILLSDETRYRAADALSAYEKAVALDPEWAEPYENIGYLYDTYFNDFGQAESAFRKAIELGAEAESYTGLAGVLAQRGDQIAEILSFLDNCPFADESAIKKMRSEIEEGQWSPVQD